MVLVPIILIAVAVTVILLIVSLIVGLGQNSVVKTEPMVTVSAAKYFILVGNTEHEITEAEAKDARKQGFTVVIR